MNKKEVLNEILRIIDWIPSHKVASETDYICAIADIQTLVEKELSGSIENETIK